MLLSTLRKAAYSLKKKILTILGDIKLFRYPGFFIYDPKSYRLNGGHFSKVSKLVKRFDVLLSRYDNYLDTGFIPGFWNHAGIYMGESELNGPVVHALAEGVLSQTLFDFMKADHICVLRPTFYYDANYVEHKVWDAIGKQYDFDFSDGDRLSCTELIDSIFKRYHTGIERKLTFLGRPAVLPDAIVNASFEKVFEIRTDSRG